MTEAQLMEALLSLVSLAVVWLLVSTAWPTHRLASFRQDLFDIRDELFDIGFRQGLFEHNSYRFLRNRINVSIRFAHKFTTFRLAVILILIKKKRLTATTDDWMLALQELPIEAQQELLAIQKKILTRVGCYMLWTPMWFVRAVENAISSSQRELARKQIEAKVELMEEQAVREVREERELALAARC